MEKFYQLADTRSRHFAGNLLKKMDEKHESLAVVITGGFHTNGMLEELRKKDIGYVSVKPRLTQQDAANPYFSLLQGRLLPLEKLLAKNQTLLAPRVLTESENYAPLVTLSYGAFGQSVLAQLPASRQDAMQTWLKARHDIVAMTRLTSQEIAKQGKLEFSTPQGCEVFLAQTRNGQNRPMLLVSKNLSTPSAGWAAITLQKAKKF
ncbi:MAG: hypothetical protein HGA87_06090, partial [Desulfobulbaceae bacterium]|nr:hypothetical protein [Desulfobulbaceae bacterium]